MPSLYWLRALVLKQPNIPPANQTTKDKEITLCSLLNNISV